MRLVKTDSCFFLRTGTILCMAVCASATGCVERLIMITSEPSGALVYLNDEEVGRTPVTVPFTFYGTYDVRLEADGHEPLWTKQKAEAPWWEAPPVDLVAEAIPGGKAHLEWHFQMNVRPEPDEPALIDRARQLRSTVSDQ